MNKQTKLYLYYKPNCPYSEKAKEKIGKHNIEVITVTEKNQSLYKNFLYNTFQHSTFPAIILEKGIDKYLIGGSDDLDKILYEENKLLANCQKSKPVFKKVIENSANKVNLNSKLMCIFFKTLYNI